MFPPLFRRGRHFKAFFQNIICYFLLIFLTHVWGGNEMRERWRFLGCDDHKSHYTFSGLRWPLILISHMHSNLNYRSIVYLKMFEFQDILIWIKIIKIHIYHFEYIHLINLCSSQGICKVDLSLKLNWLNLKIQDLMMSSFQI